MIKKVEEPAFQVWWSSVDLKPRTSPRSGIIQDCKAKVCCASSHFVSQFAFKLAGQAMVLHFCYTPYRLLWEPQIPFGIRGS